MTAGGRGPRPATWQGRRREREALDRLVADVVAGTSRVLVLRGEAGVGKSALLEHLSQQVADWRVVPLAGAESGTEFAYSGLHDLCTPLMDHLDELPVPQRDALATVLGIASGPSPDPFVVALATLSLVAAAAEAQPLACIVDDAQWLDPVTAQILAFVARRLLAERVALVCAARTGPGDGVLSGLPSLPIPRLTDEDARTLLLDSLHGPLDAAVVDRIVAECHGIPLALLELPRTWTVEELAGGFGLPEHRSVAGRIEQSYLQRLSQLPTDTQVLVLVAAADPLGDPALLGRAAEHLGLDMKVADPAVDAGLLRLRARVEFAHPLVRSATYGAAAIGNRRRAHQALAEATQPDSHPDRRAWHRALAAAGPDEEVASELVRSADRARARGGLAAAAAFLTRATELTPTTRGRTPRALDAASANVQAGAFDTALRLLTLAADGPLDGLQRAQVDMIRAQLAFSTARGNEATTLLLAAARRLEHLDLRSARATYLDAFSAAQFAARLNGGVGVAEVARAVRAAPRVPDRELNPGDLLLDAFVALTEDYTAAVPLGRRALERLRGDAIPSQSNLRWLWQGCVLALELWDDDSAYVLSHLHLRTAREMGALTELPLALGSRTPILVFCGDLSAADALVEEARSVYEAAGIAEAPYGALTTAAWRGSAPETIELTATVQREARARGEGVGVAISEYARAVLCNSLGRYDDALAAARSACADPEEMVAHNWGLPELVEAATRVGRTDLADTALDELTVKARATGTDWAMGIQARSHAMVSDAEVAEGLFRRAVEHLGRARVRGELARAHLVYGEWLRRQDRRLDARDQLSAAYGMFSAMDMQAFANRTARELVATGATVQARLTDVRDALTPQEAHIARLAQDGLSNLEIGARLFLSARTVEWHLRKVFTKLGVRSRRELGRALSNRDGADGPR